MQKTGPSQKTDQYDLIEQSHILHYLQYFTLVQAQNIPIHTTATP